MTQHKNIHGVDLSIFNNITFIEVTLQTNSKYVFRGDPLKNKASNLSYSLDSGVLSRGSRLVNCSDAIMEAHIASKQNEFFDKYPEYTHEEIGDKGVFYNEFYDDFHHPQKRDLVKKKLEFIENLKVKVLDDMDSGEYYPYGAYFAQNDDTPYTYFFKVSEKETEKQIKRRFLREVFLIDFPNDWNPWSEYDRILYELYENIYKKKFEDLVKKIHEGNTEGIDEDYFKTIFEEVFTHGLVEFNEYFESITE